MTRHNFPRTSIPKFSLKIDDTALPIVCHLNVANALAGGKGGFGTLLKGQSKKAGAKMTKNFGACRDLSGRRLRHVNDEIKLRKWYEAQKRKEAGLPEEEPSVTPSGIDGWYLAVPTWAEGQTSNKSMQAAERRLKREIQARKRAEAEKKEREDFQKAERERVVMDYANVGRGLVYDRRDGANGAASTSSFRIDQAIAKGMKVVADSKVEKDHDDKGTETKKRMMSQVLSNENKLEQFKWLASLSGEVVQGQAEDIQYFGKGKSGAQVNDNVKFIQGDSEFASGCVLLSPERMKKKRLYYEVILDTGGVAQVGWAQMGKFTPNSSNGDGVGDDNYSWGFDGSRRQKFFGGSSFEYGLNWKHGDCVGCLFDGLSGTISYLLNGKDMGVAYTVEDTSDIVPSFSLNEGEILGIRVGPNFENFPGDGYVAVSSCIDDFDAEIMDKEMLHSNKINLVPLQKRKATELNKSKLSIFGKKPDDLKGEPVDLNKYEAIEELEKLGLDRLKSALIAIGIKCG